MQSKIQGDIVKQYLSNPANAKLPRLALARIIYAENKEVFTNVERVRGAIRYYTGNAGDKHRETMGDKRFVDESRPTNYKDMMPVSHKDDWTPVEIHRAARKLLIMSDTHLPYHDERAVELAIDYGLKRGTDTILLNGDTMDFHTLSRFEPNPKARSLSEELECGRQFLDMLRVAFPGQAIYWKDGNHDERLRKYLVSKARELLHVDEFELPILLRFAEYGIQYVTEERIIMAGKLPIIHGHEVFGGASVNPARTLYLRAKASALQGHNHRTSEHTEKDIHGGMSTTWSTGCLCELHPQYMPINNWNHGFAFIEIDEDGNFEVHNKRIQEGKVM